jgi:hypothetical protein
MDTHAESSSGARYHPRVRAGFMVSVASGERRVVAKAADLSIDGLRLAGDFGRPGTRLAVAIPLPRDRVVETVATVVRRDGEWVAVKFDDLDWDDLFAMARYVHPRLEPGRAKAVTAPSAAVG